MNMGACSRRREIAYKNQSIDGLEVEPTRVHFTCLSELLILDGRMMINSSLSLQEEKVLLVHGSGFSKELGSGHIRLVPFGDKIL